MSYTDKPFIWSFLLRTADQAALNANDDDLAYLIIPAAREVEIQGMRAYVALASDTSTDSIELTKEDDTVLCQVVVGTTGHVSAKTAASQSTAQTFPIRVAPQSTTLPKLLKLKVNGANDVTTTVAVQVHITGLGHA